MKLIVSTPYQYLFDHKSFKSYDLTMKFYEHT